MSWKLWTQAEDKVIADYFQQETLRQLANRLNDRTVSAISKRAIKIGVQKGLPDWTKEEESVLEEFYPSTKRTWRKEQILKRLPHRSWVSIRSKANKMGLANPFVEDLAGKVFGNLLVLRYSRCNNGRRGWECKHTKTDKVVIVPGHRLMSGRINGNGSKRGKSNHGWKGYEEISSSFFTSTRLSAAKRGHKFEVTIEYIWELFLKQNRRCALSGCPLVFSQSWGFVPHTEIACASLDRIDSSKGYVVGNLQWVHKRLNRLKNNFAQEEFILWCNRVATFHPRTV